MLRTLTAGFVIVVIGSVCAAATYWGLLNVPESNVIALLASALLALLTIVIIALTISTALGVSGAWPIGTALRRSPSGLVGFIAGAVVLALLWWGTTQVDDAVMRHRGEIDALFLRHAGTANTTWFHAGAAWLTWLVRWGFGLSVVGALTSATLMDGARARGLSAGLRQAFSWRTLGATIAGLVIGRGLWSLAYWRPRGLATNSSELAFVAAKLGLMFIVGAFLLVGVLHVFARGTGVSSGLVDATGPQLQTRS